MPNDKRPPKDWWDKKVKEVKEGNPSYSEEQVNKTVGDIWYNQMSEGQRRYRRSSMNKEALRLRPLGPNRNEVEIGDWLVLFSYQTPVAALHQTSGEAIRTDKRWSNTTSRHVNQWLQGMDAKTVPQATLENLINTGKLEEAAPAVLNKEDAEAVQIAPGLFPTSPDSKGQRGTTGTRKRVGQGGGDDTFTRDFDSKYDTPEEELGEEYFHEGDHVVVHHRQSKPGEGLSYPDFEGVATGDGFMGGWDVWDIIPDDPSLADEDGIVSVYGFSISRPVSSKQLSAAKLPDLFNSKYVKWMQQEAALLAANLGEYTSEAEASALLDQAIQKLVATVNDAVQEEVEKVVNDSREDIVEAMMDDLLARQKGIPETPQVAGPPEIPVEFEEEPQPMAKANLDKKADLVWFDVFLNGKEIDSIPLDSKYGDTEEDVKRSLIEHDGYDPNIEVFTAERNSKFFRSRSVDKDAKSFLHPLRKRRRK